VATSRPLRDIALAFALLTAVPVRADAPALGERTHAADHFPLVGVLFGAVGVGVALLVEYAYLVGLEGIGALSLVVIWALLSRGLHWDGLADVADAWTVPAERRFEVMKDSHIGAFGVFAIVACVGLQAVAIGLLLEEGGVAGAVALGAVPVFGRFAASFGAWLGKPLPGSGLGSSVAGRPGVGAVSAVAVVSLCFAAALFVGEPAGIAACVAGLLAAPVVPHLVSMRFGGINGDVLGASVIITEVVVAVAAAVTMVVMW
jgi:adenosylcobinamide-GDP ribazoletransferase